MAVEINYGGVLSSVDVTATTTNGVPILDLLKEADQFTAVYNQFRADMLAFMGCVVTNPDADIVRQVTVKWQRFSEFGKPDARNRSEIDLAVTTGLEGFQTDIEWTDFAEVLGLAADDIRDYVAGVAVADLQDTYTKLWEQFFLSAPRTIEDILTHKVVTVLPFYYGSGDTQIPPRVGRRTFSAAHNHFLRTAASGTVTAADIMAGVGTVTEHGFDNMPIAFSDENGVDKMMNIATAAADIAKFQYSNPFVPSDAVNINQPGALAQVATRINSLFEAVGVFKGKTIIAIARDAPAGYLGFFSHQGPQSKENSLQLRLPLNANQRGLRRVASTLYPFVGNYWTNIQGIGVRQRGNGAAMQHTYTGNNTDPYVPPVFDYDIF